MNEMVNSIHTKDILKDIVMQFGLPIVRDTKRLRAVLLDYRIDKKALNLIVTILQSTAFSEVMGTGFRLTDYDKRRLLENIQNEYPFDEKYLKMGLEWWFYALGEIKGDSIEVDFVEQPMGADIRARLANDYFENKAYDEAYHLFLELAEEGDAEAENKMGILYRYGYGVDRDYDMAVEWFKKSSKSAYHDAQYHLGAMYQFGYGVPTDCGVAFELYEKAKDNGSVRAMTSLADMYEKGIFVQKNMEKAVELYRQAAEKEDTEAQTSLAYLYCEGKGVPRDYGKAFQWYTKAARSGDSLAQKGLGFMYEKGYGVTKSYNEALKWYRKANEYKA